MRPALLLRILARLLAARARRSFLSLRRPRVPEVPGLWAAVQPPPDRPVPAPPEIHAGCGAELDGRAPSCWMFAQLAVSVRAVFGESSVAAIAFALREGEEPELPPGVEIDVDALCSTPRPADPHLLAAARLGEIATLLEEGKLRAPLFAVNSIVVSKPPEHWLVAMLAEPHFVKEVLFASGRMAAYAASHEALREHVCGGGGLVVEVSAAERLASAAEELRRRRLQELLSRAPPQA